MARDLSSHKLSIMVKAVAATVARDLALDSLLPKPRNKENASLVGHQSGEKRLFVLKSHGPSTEDAKQ